MWANIVLSSYFHARMQEQLAIECCWQWTYSSYLLSVASRVFQECLHSNQQRLWFVLWILEWQNWLLGPFPSWRGLLGIRPSQQHHGINTLPHFPSFSPIISSASFWVPTPPIPIFKIGLFSRLHPPSKKQQQQLQQQKLKTKWLRQVPRCDSCWLQPCGYEIRIPQFGKDLPEMV